MVGAPETINVADAKRRFSEIIERVSRGERFLIARRGTEVMAVVPPSEVTHTGGGPPVGLAAVAGALSDWDEIDADVDALYAMRQRAVDRPAPDLG